MSIITKSYLAETCLMQVSNQPSGSTSDNIGMAIPEDPV